MPRLHIRRDHRALLAWPDLTANLDLPGDTAAGVLFNLAGAKLHDAQLRIADAGVQRDAHVARLLEVYEEYRDRTCGCAGTA